MKKIGVLSLILIIFISGFATTGTTPPRTQLQIREFQTRSYETTDVKMVMKALLNVLQDEGFIVKHASVDLGLLNATKEVDVENKGEAVLLILLVGADARWKKNSIIECTGNVSEFGNQVRVRVNFQMKVLDNKGNVIKVGQIEDSKYYQDFFSRVDKGIFLQKEKL
jgi:ribosomal protein S8